VTRGVHQLLSDAAAGCGERRAVVHPGHGEIGYSGLQRLATVVAESLDRHRIGAGNRIGIYVRKSIPAVAAMLGAMQRGCAYVPVDPTAPAARNALIMEDCTTAAALVDASLLEKAKQGWDDSIAEVVDELDETRAYGVPLILVRFRRPAIEPSPGLAYILYTSGSTGRPKGVMHTHASALSFIDWCSQEFRPDDSDRFSSHAPFHFDLSILDLYVAMKHGARVVLLDEDVGKQPKALAAIVASEAITMWYSTPSTLRLMMEYGDLASAACPSLKILCYAGEVFPTGQLRKLMQIWPHPTYYNLYGPTETNVCTYHKVVPPLPANEEALPIGRTCSGDEARVVDDEGHVVSPGTRGELVVAGGSVMQGYWNLPERNRGAFLDVDGRSWYRTGDLVEEREAGEFVYVGRKDRMVKRRGYRIELGEIEHALFRMPAIHEAAVVSCIAEDNVRVMAFVSCTAAPPSLIQLKQHCAATLPLYMIPDEFRVLHELPKTSTGKIDYQSLRNAI